MERLMFFHFQHPFEHAQRRPQAFNHQQALFLERREVTLCIGQLDPGLMDQFARLLFSLFDDEIGR
jgi:hypothetical protein